MFISKGRGGLVFSLFSHAQLPGHSASDGLPSPLPSKLWLWGKLSPGPALKPPCPKLAMKQIQSGTTVQGICLYSNDTALGHWSLLASHIYEGSTASRVLGLTVPTQSPQFQVYIISITVNWDPGELCSCGTTVPGFIFLITELSWSITLSLITVIYTGALRRKWSKYFLHLRELL